MLVYKADHKPLPPPTKAEMLVIKAQRALAAYSVPDSGVTKDQLIEQLFGILDGAVAGEVFVEVMNERYLVRQRDRA